MKNLNQIKGKTAIITHTGADTDAICAAAALLQNLPKKATIITPEHVSAQGKAVAQKLKIPHKTAKKHPLNQYNNLILVDFNETKMAGSLEKEIKKFKGTTYLVDHHAPSKKQIAKPKNSLANPNAVASCELVYDWIKKSGKKLEPKAAACIAAGITTDSAYFLTANAKTFAIMADCLNKSGKPFSYITSLFRTSQGLDEKIAKLKAAKRARIYNVAGYIAVTTDVGAFEADAASSLVKTGADIAFAGDSDQGKLRISGRASQHLIKRTGFSLAKHVFQKLPQQFPGSGGGHPGAAGFNGKGKDINQALQQCLSLTKQYFKKRKGYKFKEYD